MVTEPDELSRANLLISLCERFHKLPSEILAEDAQLLQLLQIRDRGNPPQPDQ